MPAKVRHVQVRLDPDEHKTVERWAEAEGISVQELGYRALMSYIEVAGDAKGPEPQFLARHKPLARALARLLAAGDAQDAKALQTVLDAMLKQAEGRHAAP